MVGHGASGRNAGFSMTKIGMLNSMPVTVTRASPVPNTRHAARGTRRINSLQHESSNHSRRNNEQRQRDQAHTHGDPP